MSQFRPILVYFRHFSNYNFNNTNLKSVDGLLWIGTRGHRMVGTDEITELWKKLFFAILKTLSN